MGFLNSSFSASLVSFIVGFMALFSLGLWWIIRKKVKRIWLPTVKILNLPKKSLPKLTRTKPPLIPFVCFLFCALALVIYSLKPQKIVQFESNNKQQKHHIFIDLSPSHSAYRTLDDIRSIALDIYQNLNEKVTFSISTSATPNVYDVNDLGELKKLLANLEFHKAGLRLGQAIRDRFDRLGEVDRIYFVSDADFYTWSDFQWQFLSDEIDLYRFDPRKEIKNNLFINSVTDVSERFSENAQWEVELNRTEIDRLAQGTVIVSRNGKQLNSSQWSFPTGENQIKIKVSWFEDTLPQKKDTLKFEIIPTVSDAIVMDNEFTIETTSSERRALLIADQGGELQLEDPAHHLVGTLEVVGLKTDRLDHLPEETIDLTRYNFVMIAGGTGNGLDDYCPVNAVRKASEQNDQDIKIWLAPISQNADFSELCHCLSAMKDSSVTLDNPPDFCSESKSRSSWAFLLKSIGARSVGGELGIQDSSLAWIVKSPNLEREILAFTVPLNPRTPRGFSFAQFPLTIRSLLDWQNLIATDKKNTSQWPRIEDISQHYNKPVLGSNVPYGESSLKEMNEDQLPAIWQTSNDDEFKTSFVKKQAYTPTPWIRGLVLIIIALTLIELIFSALKIIKSRRAGLGNTKNILIGLIFLFFTVDLEGQVAINALGYSGQKSSSHLSFEISSRTSIELNQQIMYRDTLNKQSLRYPWLWSRNMASLLDSKGRLQHQVVNWLKNGGFLVIEDSTDQSALDRAIKNHFTHHAFTPEWKPIPPDHEIMRSFYLLDALPTCNNQSWQGFLFDDRLAILVIPFRFLESLIDNPINLTCKNTLNREQMVRTFVNILMVALATDYKKDQIHLPEILKRLR